MKILYINHTSQVSGAERSLLTLLEGLPSRYSATLACPEGPLAMAGRGRGIPVEHLNGTDVSLRLHPWHTARAVGELARSAWSARSLARRVGADLIHANSIRAGLIAGGARKSGGPPVVVHVHDRLPPGRVSSLALRGIAATCDVALACSGYVADQIRDLPRPLPVEVVHNPIDVGRFDPARISRAEARAKLGFDESTILLGLIAQITPWKAQDDAVRMIAELKGQSPDIRLLLVGSPKFLSGATRYDNAAFAQQLDALITSLDVSDEVLLLGERDDIPEIMRALDIVLVPSWEEPFGMAVIEAMAMELPVVATNVGGASEIVIHEQNGLLVPPRRPGEWAAEIRRLVEDPDLRTAIGRKARMRVTESLNLPAYVERIVGSYEQAVASRRPRGRS
jgi:glycosyltransferase involved in cell wall biosynthesis